MTGERWSPAAVLWDLDGTLIDSQPYWHAAEYILAARYGGTWDDEHSLALTGADLLDAGRYVQRHMQIDVEPETIVEELVGLVAERLEDAVPWRPGARELLLELVDAGTPCGLVTMSYRALVEPVLASLPDGVFSAVITGDEVSHGKPHPEPYLVAAAKLGAAPQDCLAVEDSRTGASSAAAAGCRVVVAPSHVAVDRDSRWVLNDSLERLSRVGLLSLVSM